MLVVLTLLRARRRAVASRLPLVSELRVALNSSQRLSSPHKALRKELTPGDRADVPTSYSTVSFPFTLTLEFSNNPTPNNILREFPSTEFFRGTLLALLKFAKRYFYLGEKLDAPDNGLPFES